MEHIMYIIEVSILTAIILVCVIRLRLWLWDRQQRRERAKHEEDIRRWYTGAW